jgi:anthranilate phosphoribosyltransferase
MLTGEPGAVRDAVLLNAAAALVAADPAAADRPLPDALVEGLARAAQAVDSGAAAALLTRWAEASQAEPPAS